MSAKENWPLIEQALEQGRNAKKDDKCPYSKGDMRYYSWLAAFADKHGHIAAQIAAGK